MTKKKDKIKIYQLNGIKKRRMQKYHARKILRFFKDYDMDKFWIASLRMFISAKYVYSDPYLRKHIKSYSIKYSKIEK